ncbi:MAG: hypothetical protein WAU91_15915, partial [Desulfatitalea sp.]
PLLRYRTGDHAAMRYTSQEPVLMGLEGRPPVRFRTLRGEWINNIEVTHALRTIPVPRFALHQGRDGSLRLRLDGVQQYRHAITEALMALFGAGQSLTIEPFGAEEDKVVQYTTEIQEDQS